MTDTGRASRQHWACVFGMINCLGKGPKVTLELSFLGPLLGAACRGGCSHCQAEHSPDEDGSWLPSQNTGAEPKNLGLGTGNAIPTHPSGIRALIAEPFKGPQPVGSC